MWECSYDPCHISRKISQKNEPSQGQTIRFQHAGPFRQTPKRASILADVIAGQNRRGTIFEGRICSRYIISNRGHPQYH